MNCKGIARWLVLLGTVFCFLTKFKSTNLAFELDFVINNAQSIYSTFGWHSSISQALPLSFLIALLLILWDRRASEVVSPKKKDWFPDPFSRDAASWMKLSLGMRCSRRRPCFPWCKNNSCKFSLNRNYAKLKIWAFLFFILHIPEEFYNVLQRKVIKWAFC